MIEKKWTLRLMLIALMVLMSLSAAGCGGNTGEISESTGSEPIETVPVAEDGTRPEPTQAAPTAAVPTVVEPTEAAPDEEESGSAEVVLDGKLLLETRCAQCHDLGRVTSASKNAESWEKTVVRMVGKGAELNADEQAVLIEYLSTMYP